MFTWLSRIAGWIELSLGISRDVQLRILGTVAVFVVYAGVLRLVRHLASRALDDATSRYQVTKVASYTFGFVALAVVTKIWLQGVTGLATYLGLLSAGIAVALQDAVANLAGWVFIVARRPFEVGDRIQIGEQAGDVVDIRIFQFTLLEIGNWVQHDQSTGRVIHVPNGWVFKSSIANYDKGFRYIWQEIPVVLTFESNWRRAKEVLLRTVTDHAEHLTGDAARQIEEAAERYHIRFSKLTPVVWTSVRDDGICLTLRYLCKPRERRSSEHEMWESILDALEALSDVDLAYKTVRLFDNRTEGKPETRAGDAPPKIVDRPALLPKA
ncbi:MAG TPA: mechanosensitive ion channel domain-containing protein [Minicystis sp.]|nr:mechanosensitive ion channel domain-containing protein [Minicystis sp.]